MAGVANILNAAVLALYVYGRALCSAIALVLGIVWAQITSPTKNIFTAKKRDTPPKCLHDKELGQHGYVTVKGLKFHYVEKGDKSKPLMLFVHGFPEFWYSWRHQIKAFSKDYWTVAIDCRGYGDSAKPSEVSAYDMSFLVDDIKGIVTELGREKFILVAHDWGAVLGWTFVDKYPEMVEKYVMMNGPHSKIFFRLLKTSAKQAAKSWYVFLFQIPFLPELMMRLNDYAMLGRVFLEPKKSSPYVTEEDIEAYKYTFSRPGGFTLPVNYYRAAIRRNISSLLDKKPDVKRVLDKRPPGLYIFGAKDMAIEIENVNMHKETFESLETVIIAEANHFVQQDDPEAVNNAMRSYLESSK